MEEKNQISEVYMMAPTSSNYSQAWVMIPCFIFINHIIYFTSLIYLFLSVHGNERSLGAGIFVSFKHYCCLKPRSVFTLDRYLLSERTASNQRTFSFPIAVSRRALQSESGTSNNHLHTNKFFMNSLHWVEKAPGQIQILDCLLSGPNLDEFNPFT